MVNLKYSEERFTFVNGFVVKPGFWYGFKDDGVPVIIASPNITETYDGDGYYGWTFEDNKWVSSYITEDIHVVEMPKSIETHDIPFNEYLENEYGVDWNYYDENFNGSEQDRIYEEYQFYKTGLPAFARVQKGGK